MQDEQQRCGSCYIDKTSIQAASVVLHISLPATLDSLICSQVRHSGRSCTIFHALPQWIISLHVFEDDTVAKVTVSKANLNVFFGFVGPCPVLCCFAVLLCGETQIWLGDLRVVFGCGGFVVLFVVGFVMICQSFWTTRVLVHSCFSLLTQL